MPPAGSPGYHAGPADGCGWSERRYSKRWPTKSTRDPKVIAAQWTGTDHGIALDLGRSGLVVIDVDKPELLPAWLQTALADVGGPYQSTRPDAGGRGHHIFRQPAERQIGCSPGRLAGMGLDVRGVGGVIILAPTFPPDGGEYRWQTGGAITELPEVIGRTSARAASVKAPQRMPRLPRSWPSTPEAPGRNCSTPGPAHSRWRWTCTIRGYHDGPHVARRGRGSNGGLLPGARSVRQTARPVRVGQDSVIQRDRPDGRRRCRRCL